MKNKKLLMLIIISFFMCLMIASPVAGAPDNVKQVPKSVVIPQKVKFPVLKVPNIGMISQDLTPGYTLEVYGKNFGIKTLTTQFIVGGYNAEILGWQNDFILLKFPDSPTLGKKIKSYIKKGGKIVSNQFEHTMSAATGEMIPKFVFINYGSMKKVALTAVWAGTNPAGMSLRFKKIKSLVPVKPVYTKVISINGPGEAVNLNAILPSGLKAGIYLVDLIQDGRVASGPPVSFQVKKLIMMKEKLDIK